MGEDPFREDLWGLLSPGMGPGGAHTLLPGGGGGAGSGHAAPVMSAQEMAQFVAAEDLISHMIKPEPVA
jgi:hypothetical protein